MKEELIKGTGLHFYHFDPGERARVKRGRYYVSHVTPLWSDGYNCVVVRNNKNSVTIRIDGYEDELHRVDTKDLVPENYRTGTLA